MRADPISFSMAAAELARQARRLGMEVPVFRAPPGLAGADRTICRRGGRAVVAVRVRGRPLADVVADLVEGVLTANGAGGVRGTDLRRRLVESVCRAHQRAA